MIDVDEAGKRVDDLLCRVCHRDSEVRQSIRRLREAAFEAGLEAMKAHLNDECSCEPYDEPRMECPAIRSLAAKEASDGK